MLHIETRWFDKLEEKILESNLDDYLVNFLLNVIDREWKLCSKQFAFKDIYEPLRVIIEEPNSDKQIIKVKEYLEQQWYLIHKETAWFDSHKSKQNIYYGYWSYEAGAVVQYRQINAGTLALLVARSGAKQCNTMPTKLDESRQVCKCTFVLGSKIPRQVLDASTGGSKAPCL